MFTETNDQSAELLFIAAWQKESKGDRSAEKNGTGVPQSCRTPAQPARQRNTPPRTDLDLEPPLGLITVTD